MIEVICPQGTRGKDIKCKIGPQSLDLDVLTFPEGEQSIFHGQLFQKVATDESSYSVTDEGGKRKLTVTLTKEVSDVTGKAIRWLGLKR